jgi:LmbE family N-acetylglucosaminyl deacetylase
VTTVVAFHAHPDDEVLLTGGTLARLAAEGHRVVIVLACSANMKGAAGSGNPRLQELAASASALGAARVVHLGYAESGHGPVLFPDPSGMARFARADLDEAASRLAGVIREERAELLLSYDAQGGYGHRDHVKVHEVGARAARLTGTRVLEATAPRELAAWVFVPMRLLRLMVRYDRREIRLGFSPRASITHRVDVRKHAARKRAALAAHRSHWNSKGRSARLAKVMLVMPVPVFGLLLGREWFVEPGVTATEVSRHVLQPAVAGRAGEPREERERGGRSGSGGNGEGLS